MSPNERADKLMTDFMSAELHESAIAVIARHIRDAENDALERAARECGVTLETEQECAERIRALKHETVSR